MLGKILQHGKRQSDKKGDIIYLLDEQLHLTPYELAGDIRGTQIARKKLCSELALFMVRERDLTKHIEAGINWPTKRVHHHQAGIE